MTDQEAKSLARKWEVLIASMRSATTLRDLTALLQTAQADRQMPRQVREHIELVTYAETRASLRPPLPSRKDQAAGEGM